MQRMLNLREVATYVGLGKNTIYKYMRCDGFPKQIKLSEKTARWDKAEVDTWLNSRPKYEGVNNGN